jgi:hypothetical protein
MMTILSINRILPETPLRFQKCVLALKIKSTATLFERRFYRRGLLAGL